MALICLSRLALIFYKVTFGMFLNVPNAGRHLTVKNENMKLHEIHLSPQIANVRYKEVVE